MKPLEKKFSKIDGYLVSIKRDYDKGQYMLEIGIPKDWAYQSTDKIECEVLNKTPHGDFVKIYGIDNEIVIDDLIEFVNIIIDTNQQIKKMQDDFDKQIEKSKADLKKQMEDFYEKIEILKETSFEEMEKRQKEIQKKKDKDEDDQVDSLEQEMENKLSK